MGPVNITTIADDTTPVTTEELSTYTTETDFGTTTEIIDPKTTTTTPTSTTTTTAETTTTSSSFDVVCPDSADGLTVFVPLPTDCSKFFACHGSRPILMECPQGLVFDPALNVCNYPQFVDCTSS